MNKIRYTDRYCAIDDASFWSALRTQPKRDGADELARAIERGKAGKTRDAFAHLAAYHAQSLQGEWEHIQQQYAKTNEPPKKTVSDILAYRWPVWHTQIVQFDGKHIDWFPPETEATGVTGGFHYFGWFSPIATHFVKTGDAKAGKWLVNIFEQYLDLHQDKRWHGDRKQYYRNLIYNQLGVAGRFSHMLPAYLALIHHNMLTPKAAQSFAKQMLGYGRVIKPQNKEFAAHNIQTHGCRALFHIANVFPEFRESGGWRRFAAQRLVEQVTRGYYKDGCQEERVWGYSSATLRSITASWQLAQRYGGFGKDDTRYLRGMRNAYRFFAKSLGPRPQLRMPSYGDAGEGQSGAGVLEAGKAVFPNGIDDDLGVDRTASCCMRDCGFAFFRNGDDEQSTFIDLNFGPFAGWHSHYDLLSMNMFAHGEAVLDELCRFAPYSVPLDPLFRAPESHNLVTADGMVYDNRNVRGEDVGWHSNDMFDYFTATHWAYGYFVFGRDSGPVMPNLELKVRRTVVFVKDPGYALVVDSVLNRHEPRKWNRAITQRWHAPKPFKQTSVSTAHTTGRGARIAMAWAHDTGLARLDTGADFTEEEGSQWGKAHSRYFVNARRWMPLDHEGNVGFATLLFPFAGKLPEVSIRPAKCANARLWEREAYEIRTPAGRDLIAIDPAEQGGLVVAGKPLKRRVSVTLGNRRGSGEA